jgi:hypothetical protein
MNAPTLLCAPLLAAALAAPAAAAKAAAYDASFVMDLPDDLAATPMEAFVKHPPDQRPYLCLQRKVFKPGDLPVLLLSRTSGADAKSAAARELAELKARGNPDFSPSELREFRLGAGAAGYWFSNGGRKLDYSFIFFPLGGRVIRGGCPSSGRERCLWLIGTIRPNPRAAAK